MKPALPVNLNEVRAIVGWGHPVRRITHLLEYLGITMAEIARRHGCSRVNVHRVLYGIDPSLPVQLTTYGMIQDALGADAPRFEQLFDVPQDKFPQEATANG